MLYQFNTATTMKPYNHDKWWIDIDIIKSMEIEANSLKEALDKYVDEVKHKHYIEISKSAVKNKNKMYRDTLDGTQQVGYVITAKCDFEDRDNYKWSSQYIDLWVEVTQVEYTPVF